MITGNLGITRIASQKITQEERDWLKKADIVIDTITLDKSSLNKDLQSYRGLYITIPDLPREDVLYQTQAIQKQIETVRDALSERNPQQRGYYYDNAGNYIQLLQDTLSNLTSLIQKYHPLPFITIGGNFDTFIRVFQL